MKSKKKSSAKFISIKNIPVLLHTFAAKENYMDAVLKIKTTTHTLALSKNYLKKY